MRIGIIGTGGMAEALGTGWAQAGHEVLISGRSRQNADALAERIGRGAASGGLPDAAGFGDATLVAVRAEGVLDTLRAAGAAEGTLTGRALVDCTNAIAHPGMTLAPEGMALRIAEVATGAHVVKAFNLAASEVWAMSPPAFDGRPLGVPLCGDDPAALDVVRTLVRDLGCAPMDGGGLARAAYLEGMAAFVIGLLFSGQDPRAALPPFDLAFGAAA
ncbi:NADP oxidoreductase [Solihabitans fulvus]|uniref:NADP oxidoreductase n=1 Tax=Solihabitans fulvus TaxID=1892852 RepID=A0A5B2WPC6_9PSEU|nr:NAD(P)-binding domain-containing protein [Solihabitans fulvus]KAA2253813.1 NADP oxidoreductase [Solihabitans fulvus]